MKRNSIDNKLVAIFTLPFFLAGMVWLIRDSLSFRPALSPQEDEILYFVPEDLSLPGVKSIVVHENIKSPIEMKEPMLQLPNVQPERRPSQTSKVTMIVIGNLYKTAIIDGTLVREGDAVGSMVVKTIEARRVLVQSNELNSAGNLRQEIEWLYLEERQ